MKKKIIIATRGSKLAIIQAEMVRNELLKYYPDYEYELLKVTTCGDKILDKPLFNEGGKGLFIKEIEEVLLKGEADLAVHSAKDIPAKLSSEFHIAAVLERGDPFDALVSKNKLKLVDLPKGAVIGTSSLRRKAQLLMLRSDLNIINLRGNVDTRLEKLLKGEFDGVILASVALSRLGLSEYCSQVIDDRYIIPAAGQGVIAIETLRKNNFINEMLKKINHKKTYLEFEAERTLLMRLNVDCHAPVGVYCQTLSDGRFHINAGVFSVDGKNSIIRSRVGPNNVICGFELANDLIEANAKSLIQ